MHDAGMMVIGSSDFTHYEPDGRAREQDMALIGAVLELDVHRFYDILEERQVSACGMAQLPPPWSRPGAGGHQGGAAKIRHKR